MKQYPQNTILFNAAAYTVLGLQPAEGEVVYDYIENTMNGDNLYEGASKEAILNAYFEQNSFGVTWVELIKDILTDVQVQYAHS